MKKNTSITARQRQHNPVATTQDELHVSTLKAVWEGASVAMALSDRDGIVIDANDAYFRLYGYSREEIIGKDFAVIFAPKMRAQARALYTHVFASPLDSDVVETTVVSRDGTEHIVESRYSFVSVDGERKALLSIISDVTERRQLEMQKDEFLGVASHELKTPVTSIKAYGQVLQKIFRSKGVFSIRLPLETQIPLNLAYGAARTAPSISARRILVADDNQDALAMLSATLRMQGNEIAVAADGREAVQAAREFMPDVILMDIGMPHMNGYEAAKLIRAHASGRRLKLIAVTGWGQKADKVKAREAGFDAHITKPIDSHTLARVLA